MLARLGLVVALLLVPVASADAAARSGTAAETRAVRAAMDDRCRTTPRFVQVAVSSRDGRWAIYNWDDGFAATTLCSAILRRSSRGSRRWRIVESRRGTEVFDRSIQPCPRALPRDLRRTVFPRGAKDPLVYCGN